MGRTKRKLLLGVLILAGIFTALAGHKADEGKQRAKARYYYLKGAVSEAEDRMDEAYEFYKKSRKEDPSYAEASYAYGFNRMALSEDTFSSRTELRRDLGMMRSLLDLYPADVESAERYAYAASLADTVPEALRVYEVLVKKRPGLSRLYGPLSYYHIASGNIEEAVRAIREFERLEGATSQTTVRKVSYYVSGGDTISALGEVRKYAESNPGIPEPLIDKAMIYNLLGRQDSAIFFLEEAIREFPDNSEMKFDIGMLYAEKGDSARFHKLVEEAFKGEGLEYEDRIQMLDAYTKSLPFGGSDYSHSDALFEYAASLYPDNADFFDSYADYELIKPDYAKALEREKRALMLNPVEPSFLGRVLSFSIVAGKPAEGMKYFEDFPDSHLRKQFNLLLTYISAAQIEEDYDKALQWLDTLLCNETSGLTLGEKLTGEKKDSLKRVYDSTALYRAGVAYEVAGDIYAKSGKVDDAARAYENAIVAMPYKDAGVFNNYAYYIVETLKAPPGSPLFEKAKEMSRESLELSSDNPSGNNYDTYAWILFKEGNYKEALDYQEIAVELEENDATAELYSHYGDILFMNGKSQEALEQWTKALELEPEDTLLKKKVENKTYFSE